MAYIVLMHIAVFSSLGQQKHIVRFDIYLRHYSTFVLRETQFSGGLVSQNSEVMNSSCKK